MDPFEVRMQFLTQLGRLSSSLASIQRLSSFALKHAHKCGHDIWDCLVEECQSMNLNERINLLYFLDTLLDKQAEPYKDLIKRDLPTVVEMVVPKTREGVLNLMSTNQVLRSWRTRRVLDVQLLDGILSTLESRNFSTTTSSEPSTSSLTSFSRNDILRRIEDDRERHKRLRERIWVLPVPTSIFPSSSSSNSSHTFLPPSSAHPIPSSSTPSTKPSPSSLTPNSPASPGEGGGGGGGGAGHKHKKAKLSIPPPPPPPTLAGGGGRRGPEVAIEIEFDQLWEQCEEERKAFLEGEGGAGDEEVEKSKDIEEGGEGDMVKETEWKLTKEEREVLKRERARCFRGDQS